MKRFYNMSSRFQGDDREPVRVREKGRENKNVARYCFLEWRSLVQCSPALVDRYQMYPDRLVSTVISRHPIRHDYAFQHPKMFFIFRIKTNILQVSNDNKWIFRFRKDWSKGFLDIQSYQEIQQRRYLTNTKSYIFFFFK